MRILGFDTADDYCALALIEKGEVIDTILVATERDQARLLAPLTQELLQKHTLNPKDIDRFAIATGPGSFTGIRVGLAFVRGLGLATGKPVLGFDHFTCAARTLKAEPPILIIRQSKRAELFCCWYTNQQKQDEPFLAPLKKIASLLDQKPHGLYTGNANAMLAQAFPALKVRAIEAQVRHAAGDAALLTAACANAAAFPAQPVYLREADVSFPKNHRV